MCAGNDGRIIMLLLVLLFIVIGDFMDAVPAIIIFMPIVIKLNELGNIKPLHMGVVLITTLVFGLITPPYGLSLLVASKFVGVRFSQAMYASLPIYVVFFVAIGFTVLFPDSRAVSAETVAAGIGWLFQEPDRRQAISARRSSFRVRLDQFDPVAERIVDMAPVVALDRLVCRDFVTGLHGFRHHAGKVIDDESRMRLARRNKILFDAQMDLQVRRFRTSSRRARPAAAASPFPRARGCHGRMPSPRLPARAASQSKCDRYDELAFGYLVGESDLYPLSLNRIAAVNRDGRTSNGIIAGRQVNLPTSVASKT